MHDIDRALFESEDEYETYGEAEGGDRETALATELLEVSSEEELDRFLGDLISSVASTARGFAGSATGRAVGGMLKQAARNVLPRIGQALGDAVAPGAGGSLGRQAGTWLGGQFEGLSAEDREYEMARTFVRFADEAAQRAVQAPAGTPPVEAARAAAIAAAQRHLPGLARPTNGHRGPRAEGRWVRRGNRIVIFDA